MYFTYQFFFFQHWNLLIWSTIHFNAQRFTESTQSLEIFKQSSRLCGERSAERSAVGNIIWLSMHPRISIVTKSSIRMAALHVRWCKISHQLGPLLLGLLSRSESRIGKSPGRSPMCWYWQPCYGQLTALKIVWLYRGRRCPTHWEKKEIKKKNKTNTL